MRFARKVVALAWIVFSVWLVWGNWGAVFALANTIGATAVLVGKRS